MDYRFEISKEIAKMIDSHLCDLDRAKERLAERDGQRLLRIREIILNMNGDSKQDALDIIDDLLYS